jgi:hypothetical protein
MALHVRMSVGALLLALLASSCGGATAPSNQGPSGDGGVDSSERDVLADSPSDATTMDVADSGADSGHDSSVGFDSGDAQPACTASTCPAGCCTSVGCSAGTSASACGFAGQACTDCTAIELTCIPSLDGGTGGTCGSVDDGGSDGAVCGPATCPGCCEAGMCLPGTAANDCGSHGLACEQCTASTEACAAQAVGGVCVGSGSSCSPSTCQGCCDSGGACQDPVAIGACGAGGVACSFCLPGQACNSGQCQNVPGCGPANCLGCCQGTTCLAGSSDNMTCGSGGAACQNCTAHGASCFALGAKSGGECTSGESCGSGGCGGCCDDFYQCHPGNTDTYCLGGVDGGGGKCGTCGGSCVTGTCVGGPFCNQDTCNGCCMPDGTCWTTGQDSAHCGGDGSLCVNCGPGYVCDQTASHTCTSTCSPQNCQGCCVGGICSTGTDPTSCGAGGDLCVQCAGGQSCVDGACITLTQCGATLCAGCCDGDDVCHTGTGDTLCGTGGNACQDCADGGQACQGGVCSP